MATQNVDNVALPLSQANGGTGVTVSSTIIQQVQTTIAPAVVTAQTPFVTTAALISYGTQVSSLAITPLFSTSILDIFATIHIMDAPAQVSANAFILHRDGGNGIAATMNGYGTNNCGSIISLRKRVSAGSTSTTTFTLRVGTETGLTTITVNGYNSAGIYNSVVQTQFVITEYMP